VRRLSLVALAGCSQIFGLSDPELRTSDAAIADVLQDTRPKCVGDDFNDNMLAGFWTRTQFNGGALAETGGRLEINFGMASGAYDGIFMSLDALDRAISVEVVRALPGENQTYLNIAMAAGQNSGVHMGVIRSTLTMQVMENGSVVNIHELAYLPAEHRYWQVRIIAATMFTTGKAIFSTSTNGTSWLKQFESTLSFSLAQAYAGMYAIQNTASTTNGAAIFDNYVIDDGSCAP
jgi:hypothetical protein